MSSIKILLVGPCKAGKTALANFLSGRADSPYPEYTPTVGCRWVGVSRDRDCQHRHQPLSPKPITAPELWAASAPAAATLLMMAAVGRVVCLARPCRILEFDAATHSSASWKGGQESIELWDCSGDKKYESCFPALAKDAVGVILVYNPEDQAQVGDIQYWCGSALATASFCRFPLT